MSIKSVLDKIKKIDISRLSHSYLKLIVFNQGFKFGCIKDALLVQQEADWNQCKKSFMHTSTELFSKLLGQVVNRYLIHLLFLPNLRKTFWLLIKTTRTEIWFEDIHRTRQFGSVIKEIPLQKLRMTKFRQVLAVSICLKKTSVLISINGIKQFGSSECRLLRLHKHNY